MISIEGVKVGHSELKRRPTGSTVLVFEQGAVAGVDVRGGSPGTREFALLNPVASVERIHAIVISGGSAFGLDAAGGVVRWLEEKEIGFDVGIAKIPIVCSAILYDLDVGGSPDIRPGQDCGFEAAESASIDWPPQGSVGAGAGASVGKLLGIRRAMKGGVGSACETLADGSVVAAIVVVNSLGNVIDPASGGVLAGVRSEDGRSIIDSRTLIREDKHRNPLSATNTTIGVIVTDASLSRADATRVARTAQDGLARAIVPAHTPFDGDAVFAASTGARRSRADLLALGSVAADVLSEAIVCAVRNAEGLPDLPSLSDMNRNS